VKGPEDPHEMECGEDLIVGDGKLLLEEGVLAAERRDRHPVHIRWVLSCLQLAVWVTV